MTRHDLEIIRGDSWSSLVYFKDYAGAAVNISGDSLYFTIKSCNIGDTDDSAASYSQNVTSHVNATGGISQVSLPATGSAAMSVGQYNYDISWKTAANSVSTLVMGKINLLTDVTRRD